MRINKIIFLTVAFLALASSCVKEEIQEDTTQIQSPVDLPSDEAVAAEKAILKSLLAGRETKWTVDDLDIPTLNEGWYEIRTANELAYLLEFGSTKGEKYRLMANIDVSESSIADKFPGEIGAEPFENFEFDGNGKIISGLDLPLAAGLFSRVKDSKIYDFTLAFSTVGSADNVSNLLGTGAVIGSASGEIEVSNVTVSGCNIYAPCKLGGFVGEVADGSATFTSCTVSATNVNGMYLKGISGWCGGFVGFVGRTREDDTASMVNVTFDNCDVNEGAVKPYMESALRTCGQFLGILIGFDSNETVTMTGCDVQTTYEVQTNEDQTTNEVQDAKFQVNPFIGGHKYENGIILVDGRDYNEYYELSVISFNIRVPGDILSEIRNEKNSWSSRKSATPAMIKDYCPDIFGVQEALSDQLTYVGENLPNYSYVGVGRDDGKKSGEIMAIFYNTSKIKLLEWGTYWLSETPDEHSKGWDAGYKRTMTWAKMQMKYSGKEFFYVNTHLDNEGPLARENGLKLILDKIAEKNSDNHPVVLTGDFNIIPTDSVLDVLADAEMLDARTTAPKTDNLATFNDWGNKNTEKVIDYIYYRGFSSCPEYETIVKQYANIQYISDHYPIVARLMF